MFVEKEKDGFMEKKNRKTASPKSWLATDDKGMVLRLEEEGKWLIASSLFDPELVTQARSIAEAFENAYDVQKGLEAARAELARSRSPEPVVRAPRAPKADGRSLAKKSRRTKPHEGHP